MVAMSAATLGVVQRAPNPFRGPRRLRRGTRSLGQFLARTDHVSGSQFDVTVRFQSIQGLAPRPLGRAWMPGVGPG